MSMRRYVLVRAAWQVGMLFVFVSAAYVVAWVLADETLGREPGYGGFLSNLAHGSLGRVAPAVGAGVAPRPSVDSVVWGATKVTLSLLLVTGVFAVALGALLALALVRAPRLRPVARAIGFVCVSLLPIWTALYLEVYPGSRWELVRFSGYCPLHATAGYRCHGLGPWLSSLIVPALALAIFFGGDLRPVAGGRVPSRSSRMALRGRCGTRPRPGSTERATVAWPRLCQTAVA